MKRQLLIVGLVCLGLTISATGDDKQGPGPNVQTPTNSAFEKLKKLAGTWVVADEKGEPTDQVVSVIRLTAAGSALHETLYPGEPHEMISIYTPDGEDIVMTHYCALGNQPQMRAKGGSSGNSLSFEFVGGTNLNPKKDLHMHSAVLTLIDDDHFEVEGVAWDNGKPSEMKCEKMKLVRKK